MTGIRGLLPLLGLAAGAAELRAQIVVIPNPYVSSTGFYYARPSRHSSLAFAIGATNVAPAYYSGYGNPYPGITQVTVIYPSPPPVVLSTVPAPRIMRLDDLGMLDPELRAEVPPPKPAAPPPDPPLPGGREAGVFRPLAPDNRDRAGRPIPPEQPKRPEALPNPAADLPKPPRPDADPKTEAERQLKIGKEALAGREYGRAIQRFRDATKLTPDDALPFLLLGQSLFAAGRYAEAVEAIRKGVGLRPDWPNARFVPRDLYGPNAADYTDHLRRLRDALEVLPDDPVLLFLYGYELWFDGRQDEARPLFRKARPGAGDPAVIDRFLAARPAL